MALPGLRYTKSALLVFGAGALLGLVVVAVKLPGLARVASLAMALGIAALPVALVADWRRRSAPKPTTRKGRPRKPKARRKPAAKPRRGGRR
jgi:hypothetical protein